MPILLATKPKAHGRLKFAELILLVLTCLACEETFSIDPMRTTCASGADSMSQEVSTPFNSFDRQRVAGGKARFGRRNDRRHFIGGSDARIIMGQDEKALVRLWREKRGEAEPKDLSTNLVVQLGVVTEDLNRHWYERNTGKAVKNIQVPGEPPDHAMDRRPHSMASVEGTRAVSRPSSCCRGRSRKKRRPRSTWLSSSATCG